MEAAEGSDRAAAKDPPIHMFSLSLLHTQAHAHYINASHVAGGRMLCNRFLTVIEEYDLAWSVYTMTPGCRASRGGVGEGEAVTEALRNPELP